MSTPYRFIPEEAKQVAPKLQGNIAKQVAPSMLDDVVSVLDNSWAPFGHQKTGGGVSD